MTLAGRPSRPGSGSGVKTSHGTITSQMRQLGSSVDWSRERFTLDDSLSRAVRRVFVSLYRDGLIYRGTYLVSWCPRCRTALSDLEVVHKESKGRLYQIRYPYTDGEGGVVVATTRPETMLGDTAVAVHPDDRRYQSVLGPHRSASDRGAGSCRSFRMPSSTPSSGLAP